MRYSVLTALSLLALTTTGGYGDAPPGRYVVDTTVGTVYDTTTGLLWERAGSTIPDPWGMQLAYCENLSLGGYSDWRMPSLKELQTIIDETRIDPAIDTSAFPAPSDVTYWSSTPYEPAPSSAYAVRFDLGTTIKSNSNGSVRCVR